VSREIEIGGGGEVSNPSYFFVFETEQAPSAEPTRTYATHETERFTLVEFAWGAIAVLIGTLASFVLAGVGL
jgi:hypothetical protein